MFELTNAQRLCFALPPVLDTWEKVEVKPGPYDMWNMYAYLEGRKIVKVIRICEEDGHEMYNEFAVDRRVSEDGIKLLPKTAKGKPVNFTTSNLTKCTPVGMELYYTNGSVTLSNHASNQCFYRSIYEGVKINNFTSFISWVEDWCGNTGENEQTEINGFASRTKSHQPFKEGDFFRYRINRTLYGYGRILLDFAKMRKEGTPFWDMFMGKPLCVAIYHIATADAHMSPEQLVGRKMQPSHMIMDNIFYYGECEIIGNKPLVAAEEDYPIHYGSQKADRLNYQCGKLFVSLENEKVSFFSKRRYWMELEGCAPHIE